MPRSLSKIREMLDFNENCLTETLITMEHLFRPAGAKFYSSSCRKYIGERNEEFSHTLIASEMIIKTNNNDRFVISCNITIVLYTIITAYRIILSK